jgi:predicted anti-sigma-YlaC factor YlaD
MIHLSDESLNEYLDKALAPADCLEVDAHLAACPACEARLAELRSLFAGLDLLSERTLEVDLVPRVLSRLSESALPRPVRWLTVAQASAAIIVAVVAWPLVAALLPVGMMPSLPSLNESIASLALWFGTVGVFQLPTLSLNIPSFSLGIPSTTLAIAMLGMSFLWLLSNGLLLIPRSRRHP